MVGVERTRPSFAEAQPVDVVQRRIGEDVDDFVDLDLVDLADDAGQREGKHVSGVARVDATAVERGSAFLAGSADLGTVVAEVRCRIKEPTRGDDVLA